MFVLRRGPYSASCDLEASFKFKLQCITRSLRLFCLAESQQSKAEGLGLDEMYLIEMQDKR